MTRRRPAAEPVAVRPSPRGHRRLRCIHVPVSAALVAIAVAAAGCGQAPAPDIKPIVTVVTPLDGARYEPGEVVNLTIAAASSRNIARVELSLDGSIVATQVNPEPAPTFSTRIAYTPRGQGVIQLQIVAIDATGASSDPDRLSLQIGDVPPPTAAPAAAPAPTNGEATGPNGCVLQAAFLQDVNVPDGTPIESGAAFNKTWRMQNTSGCDWGEGYTLVFETDTPMSANGVAPVLPTPSNGVFDVTVELTAPAQPGVYTSTWRLKDPGGQFFGNRVFVVIRVP